jgi:hypothetical protein
MNNITVIKILVIVALLLTIGNAAWKVPLWVAVFVLCVIGLLTAFPFK